MWGLATAGEAAFPALMGALACLPTHQPTATPDTADDETTDDATAGSKTSERSNLSRDSLSTLKHACHALGEGTTYPKPERVAALVGVADSLGVWLDEARSQRRLAATEAGTLSVQSRSQSHKI